jgi:hypothetical protein
MLTLLLGRMYIIVYATAALGAGNAESYYARLMRQTSPYRLPPSSLASALQVLAVTSPVCISLQFQVLHIRRLTDCVSKLWPRSSASAPLAIAEVLKPRSTSQVPAKAISLWH